MVLKFVMNLIIFLTFNVSLSVNALIEIDEQDVGLCTANAGLIWMFTWPYFKDMHAVAILGYEDTSLDFSNEIMRCSMQTPELSVQYNSSIWNTKIGQEKRSLIKGEIFYRHEMNGLVFIKESSDNIETIFPPIDQETKVVLILTDATEDDVNDVIKLAWSQYNILDLVIFRIENRLKAMQGNLLDLYVSVYNPFIIRNDSKVFVYTFLMKYDVLIISKLINILNTRLINVHSYPLKVVTFDKTVYDIARCTNLNCEIIHAIIETLNFVPIYSKAELGDEWHEIEAERADMVARLIKISYYGQRNFVYLFPVDFLRNAFMTPKMQPRTTISFFKIFSPGVSIALTCSYIAMVISWRWFQKLHLEQTRSTDFTKICCIVFGNFLLMVQPGNGERRYERCLFVSWVLFSMVICFHYQATMVQHLTTGDLSRDINTLEELADSDLKILLINIDKHLIELVAADKESPQYYRKILERSEVILLNQSHNAVSRVAKRRDAALISNVEECEFYKLLLYSKESGKDTINILEEEFFGRYSSLEVPLSSPYKERFNGILMKISESGLMIKWRRNWQFHSERNYLMRRVYNPEPRNDVYRMKDLSFIFWSWLRCCGFCCLIFFLELLWDHGRKIMNRVTLFSSFGQ